MDYYHKFVSEGKPRVKFPQVFASLLAHQSDSPEPFLCGPSSSSPPSVLEKEASNSSDIKGFYLISFDSSQVGIR